MRFSEENPQTLKEGELSMPARIADLESQLRAAEKSYEAMRHDWYTEHESLLGARKTIEAVRAVAEPHVHHTRWGDGKGGELDCAQMAKRIGQSKVAEECSRCTWDAILEVKE